MGANPVLLAMAERLQKVLSQWGIASRRQAEQMILDGRVRLNGMTAHLGQKVDPNCDRIEVDRRLVQPEQRPNLVYLLLNKPVGYVSTCHDPQSRRTVVDLLPMALRQGHGIHPVGRLDADSTGALLLTNDGELTFLLTHPRYHVPKTYLAWVNGVPSETILHQWRTGVELDGQLTLPAEVKERRRVGIQRTLLEITLYEGRNRQIRRVAERLGHPVLRLHRTAIGPISLRVANHRFLPSGQYRTLGWAEVNSLKQLTYDQRQKSGAREEVVDV